MKLGHVDGGDAGRDQLALREDVGIVDAHGGAVQEVGRVHRDVDVVEADRGQQFVDLGRADGPHVVQRVGLVGAVEDTSASGWCRRPAADIPRKRNSCAGTGCAGESAEVDIRGQSILALVLRMDGGRVPDLGCR